MSNIVDTNGTTIEPGMTVEHETKGLGAVEKIEKGWVTIADLDGGDEWKARGKDLTILTDEDLDDDEDENRMAGTLARYKPKYVASVAASGAASQHNGDAVAAILEGLGHEEVMAMAEELLDMEPGTLVAKYAHLNNGQKRMNSGNRIRAAVKRGDLTVSEDGTRIVEAVYGTAV